MFYLFGGVLSERVLYGPKANLHFLTSPRRDHREVRSVLELPRERSTVPTYSRRPVFNLEKVLEK